MTLEKPSSLEIGLMGASPNAVIQSELRSYDVFNRLKSVNSGAGEIQYAYQPDNLRLSKTVNGVKTSHVWDGQFMAAEMNASNAVTGRYLRGGGGRLISALDSGSVSQYYLYNGHGDVTGVVNASGTLTKSYLYDGFGNEINKVPGDANPFRYCGEYMDLSSGNYYLRNRYYNPSNGRFLTEDPHWNIKNMIYGDSGGKAIPSITAIMQSNNRYTFCMNNPIFYIDHSGLDAIILANKNGARSSNENDKEGIAFGHIGSLVQNKDGDWYYFSSGKGYVTFKAVPREYLTDIAKFSDEFYGGGTYTDSVYIKGDFSDSYDYFSNYYEKNKGDNNASYEQFTNNCSQVVYNGLTLGQLQDGTNVGSFMNFRPGATKPRWQIDVYKALFLNDAFTYDSYQKQIGAKLWKAQHGEWYNRNIMVSWRLKKLY